MRQVCEVGGFTQGMLSREAKVERQQLIKIGEIRPDDPVGSLEQPTISKVMAGAQAPTYYQVYIWLAVLRKHYKSPRFAKICEEFGEELPEFFPEWEQYLWHLASFMPPDKLRQINTKAKDLEIIAIYPSRIDHKERRWEGAKKKARSPGTSSWANAV